MIKDLLYFAKSRFLLDSGQSSSIADTFLSHVELIEQLILSKSLPPNFNLRDLSDPSKVRQLRDGLLASDRTKLAMEVAVRTR
jgi:hypothetical protein